MSLGYFSPGVPENAAFSWIVVSGSSATAANRRIQLAGKSGQVWIRCDDEEVFVEFGDDTVDATIPAPAAGVPVAINKWPIPPGSGVSISTSGHPYVSVVTVSAVRVYVIEINS